MIDKEKIDREKNLSSSSSSSSSSSLSVIICQIVYN
jgi:hypothetical protein